MKKTFCETSFNTHRKVRIKNKATKNHRGTFAIKEKSVSYPTPQNNPNNGLKKPVVNV